MAASCPWGDRCCRKLSLCSTQWGHFSIKICCWPMYAQFCYTSLYLTCLLLYPTRSRCDRGEQLLSSGEFAGLKVQKLGSEAQFCDLLFEHKPFMNAFIYLLIVLLFIHASAYSLAHDSWQHILHLSPHPSKFFVGSLFDSSEPISSSLNPRVVSRSKKRSCN